jgi:hypothetical protein
MERLASARAHLQDALKYLTRALEEKENALQSHWLLQASLSSSKAAVDIGRYLTGL